MKSNQILILAVIISIASFFFLSGCKAKQPLQEVIKEKIVNFDSISQSKIITKNLAINDSLSIIIGKVRTERKECDSVAQIAIDRLLSQLNTKKSSGNNNYSVFYDPNNNTLNMNTHVGATKSDSIVYNHVIYRTNTVYSHKDIPVDKPLPKWQLYLMIIGAGGIGYFIFKIVLFVRSKTMPV